MLQLLCLQKSKGKTLFLLTKVARKSHTCYNPIARRNTGQFYMAVLCFGLVMFRRSNQLVRVRKISYLALKYLVLLPQTQLANVPVSPCRLKQGFEVVSKTGLLLCCCPIDFSNEKAGSYSCNLNMTYTITILQVYGCCFARR